MHRVNAINGVVFGVYQNNRSSTQQTRVDRESMREGEILIKIGEEFLSIPKKMEVNFRITAQTITLGGFFSAISSQNFGNEGYNL